MHAFEKRSKFVVFVRFIFSSRLNIDDVFNVGVCVCVIARARAAAKIVRSFSTSTGHCDGFVCRVGTTRQLAGLYKAAAASVES
jgi:hypothetical protein